MRSSSPKKAACASMSRMMEGRERRFLRFEVRDTGVGVPTEKREEIFEEFVQADSSHARKFGGTGLGLAISKRLVEAMGGEIGIEPAPGGGSTFWFTLPAVVVVAGARRRARPLEDIRVAIVTRNLRPARRTDGPDPCGRRRGRGAGRARRRQARLCRDRRGNGSRSRSAHISGCDAAVARAASRRQRATGWRS